MSGYLRQEGSAVLPKQARGESRIKPTSLCSVMGWDKRSQGLKNRDLSEGPWALASRVLTATGKIVNL